MAADGDADAATLEPDSDHTVDLATAVEVLEEGDVELAARMPYSSNATFLVHVTHGDVRAAAVYKPVAGERPLWDFPAGLHRREIAMFELADHLGWAVIPPTVERDGPHGTGSVQLFIDADFEQHHFTLVKNPAHHDDLRTLCVLDLLANNTDRKSGHCLLSSWGRIYGIDHGLCFASDFKLRTVIWDFAGDPIPAPLRAGAERLLDEVPDRVARWLDDDEIEALQDRADWVAAMDCFPDDDTGHRWPWPLV